MSGSADIDSVAAAAAELYGVPANEFVAHRDELARTLRSAGQRELAAAVKALRRPTAVADELNRILRADPGARDEVIATARALSAGQRRVLAGEPGDVAGLQSAHRRAVATVVAAATRYHDQLRAALEAASIDEALHDQLRAAAFAVEPTPTRGFDLLADVVPLDRAPRAGSKPDPAPPPVRPSRTGPSRTGPTRLTAVGQPAPTTAPLPTAPPPRAADQAQARVLAQRRVDAARAGLAKAAQRLTDLEDRLEAARRHHDEMAGRLAAAEAALARLDP